MAALNYLPTLHNVSKAHLVLKFSYILGDSLPDLPSSLKFISSSNWISNLKYKNEKCTDLNHKRQKISNQYRLKLKNVSFFVILLSNVFS